MYTFKVGDVAILNDPESMYHDHLVVVIRVKGTNYIINLLHPTAYRDQYYFGMAGTVSHEQLTKVVE